MVVLSTAKSYCSLIAFASDTDRNTVTTDEFSVCVLLVFVSAYNTLEFSASWSIMPGKSNVGTETVSENERINCELFRFKLNPSNSGGTPSATTLVAGRPLSSVIASTGLLFMSLILPNITVM